MAIPKSQLETWAHQGAIAGSSSTYATIKRALEASDSKYAGKSYEVFLQGSYGNDTNIYAESDVDVVIRLDDVYYYDISGLTPEEQGGFNAGLIPGTYAYSQYKADVIAALVKSFGAADVKAENKAVKIKASGSRRSADVVVACDFHRYFQGMLGVQYVSGICFFDSSNNRIVNYPKQHSVNCTAKHQGTNEWFKPAVRILKNMRSKLVDDGVIGQGIGPSYFLEGLLYNVPNGEFGGSYEATMVAAINWVLKADRSKFLCANEEYYLVRDTAVTWPVANCDRFLDAVTQLWKNWP